MRTEAQHPAALCRPDLRGAFTLVEVILAIAIATGLLIVALTFYRQSADLRGQILTESERLSTIRLVLDRMVADLRAAQPMSGTEDGFTGGSNSLRFTRSALSPPDHGNALGAATGVSDLARVTFTTINETEGTNTTVIGFDRSEEPLGVGRKSSVPPALSDIPDETTGLTNRVGEPLTDQIRFVRFRYWDGTVWQTGWTNASPPPGVEIVLGTDPLPDDATPEKYPYEQFRRVVVLPAGQAPSRPAIIDASTSAVLP